MFMVKGVMQASMEEGRIAVGNLKHKDLDGRVVASQLCADSSSEEDEDSSEVAGSGRGEDSGQQGHNESAGEDSQT
jgi:hypothetical protein